MKISMIELTDDLKYQALLRIYPVIQNEEMFWSSEDGKLFKDQNLAIFNQACLMENK